MLKYVVKRILIFIPTFFIISLVIFGLSKMAPGDPVELALKGGTQAGDAGLAANMIAAEKAYSEKAAELGLDKPTFYFLFTSAAYPDTLYKIKKSHHRELVSRLIDKHGNAKEIMGYYGLLRNFELSSANVSDSANHLVKQNIRDAVNNLYVEHGDSSIMYQMSVIKEELPKDKEFARFSNQWEQVMAAYATVKANANTTALYIPTLNFYGFDNQYHRWITKFLVGDFGVSYRDNRPVAQHLWDSLWWTLVMNFISIIISYVISIPLGVRGAIWKKDADKYFPLFSWAALGSAAVIAGMILLYKFSVVPSKVAVWTTVVVTVLYSIYAIFYREDQDNKDGLGRKIAMLLLGLVVFSAVSVVDYFLYVGLGALGTLLQVLLICAIATAQIILAVKYIGGERLTKIMTDTGDFFLAATVLWTLVALPWIIKGTIKFVISFPILSGVLVLLFAFAWWWGRRKRGLQPEGGGEQHLTQPRLTFSITRWGIRTKGSFIDGIATLVLFILYSLPSFWIGTIFIVFITTSEYGMDWFPTGVGMVKDVDKLPWFDRMLNTSYELVLPVFCVTYSSFAYLSRQMRGSVLAVVRQDYIRTAKAKGLSEEKVIWKHAFRNSLFPLITLFSSVFPRALSGAIAIELIYNIPGMGKLVLESIVARDWPIVFTVVMFSAVLTMIGNLIADMLYAAADPRVSYS